ncbi:MAG: rhomboid family intramembrane serine protease [Bdellovibrionales bacterium]|nr:rhomboid family intramembrane serine protease [Bdellovibrionales bacterium]
METETYTVIRSTWLSRRPAAEAQTWVFWSFVVLAFATFLYWRGFFGAQQWMPATAQQVFQQNEYWRLWTTVFAHSNIGHFAANSLLFVTLGYFLAGYFGPGLFPFSALVFGGVINAFSLYTYAPEVTLIGASGVVSWMGGTWLTLYMALNRKITVWQRALRAIAVFLVIFAPSETFDPQISYRTHLIGFVLGLLWGSVYFLMRKREFRAAEVTETVVEEFNTAPLDEVSNP